MNRGGKLPGMKTRLSARNLLRRGMCPSAQTEPWDAGWQI